MDAQTEDVKVEVPRGRMPLKTLIPVLLKQKPMTERELFGILSNEELNYSSSSVTVTLSQLRQAGVILRGAIHEGKLIVATRQGPRLGYNWKWYASDYDFTAEGWNGTYGTAT